MARKNNKNNQKNSPSNTTIQTGRNCKDEAQKMETEHPNRLDIKNER